MKNKNISFWLSRKINFPFVPPQIMQISLTYRCNLRCRMCSIAGLLPQEEELSTEQVFHVIDEAKKYGIKEVLFTGGEPFIREDIFQICKYCHDQGLRSIITTNGAIIDADMIEAISNSMIGHIHISLDGLEETNDFFRGKGAFKKIINSIKMLDEARKTGKFFSLGFACTVMDKNVKELYEIVKMADALNVDVINFQPLVKDNSNFIDKKLPEFWIGSEKISILAEEIDKINNYIPKHVTVLKEPQLDLLVKYYKGELSKKDWVCFGGFKTVFICFSKNEPLVYSCHGICGNLSKDSLRASWKSKEALKLRVHSKNCKDLCLQSCYSLENAQSISNLYFRGQKPCLLRQGWIMAAQVFRLKKPRALARGASLKSGNN